MENAQVKEMSLDENGEKPKFDQDGKKMLYIEKEDEEKFWNLIEKVKLARGNVKVLYEEIQLEHHSVEALLKLNTLYESFVNKLSRLIDQDPEISTKIQDQDFIGFIDHLMFLGKDQIAKIILSKGAELKNKGNTLYWNPKDKLPWQFHLKDQNKKKVYWSEIIPKEMERISNQIN